MPGSVPRAAMPEVEITLICCRSTCTVVGKASALSIVSTGRSAPRAASGVCPPRPECGRMPFLQSIHWPIIRSAWSPSVISPRSTASSFRDRPVLAERALDDDVVDARAAPIHGDLDPGSRPANSAPARISHPLDGERADCRSLIENRCVRLCRCAEPWRILALVWTGLGWASLMGVAAALGAP